MDSCKNKYKSGQDWSFPSRWHCPDLKNGNDILWWFMGQRSNKYKHCTSFHHQCFFSFGLFFLFCCRFFHSLFGQNLGASQSRFIFLALIKSPNTIHSLLQWGRNRPGKIQLARIKVCSLCISKKKNKIQSPDRIRQMCLGYGYLDESHSPTSHKFTNTSKSIHRSGHDYGPSTGREGTGHQVKKERKAIAMPKQGGQIRW